MDANNQNAPANEGTSTEAGNDDVTKEVIPVGNEGNGEKGKPDDPELLRARMTQATQDAAEVKRELEAAKAELEELKKPKPNETAKEKKLRLDNMSDQQRQVYKGITEYMDLYLEEKGMTPEAFNALKQGSVQDKHIAAKERMMNNFYDKHPEALSDKAIDKELAGIITDAKKQGENIYPETAWTIYEARHGKAKKTNVIDEIAAKKDNSLLKPQSKNVGVKPAGRPSRRQAVLDALASTPE
jgi:uncharacterized membrane-anchored protein YhcB (DUF1043 family)